MSPELATDHHHAHGPANRRRWVLPTAAPLFVRHPRTAAGSGVIVLHDVHGLVPDVEQRCRDLARSGHVAVAPYLYYETGGAEFRSQDEEAALAAMSLRAPEDVDADVSAAVEHLEDKVGVPRARIGVLGLGLGGYLATRACAERALGGAVAFDPPERESLPWPDVEATAELLPGLRTPWLAIAGSTSIPERAALLAAAERSRGPADVHVPDGPAQGEFDSWDEALRFLHACF